MNGGRSKTIRVIVVVFETGFPLLGDRSTFMPARKQNAPVEMSQPERKTMKTRTTSSMSQTPSKVSLANNHSRSERSQIMRQDDYVSPNVFAPCWSGAFFVGAFAFTVLTTSPGAIRIYLHHDRRPGRHVHHCHRDQCSRPDRGHFHRCRGRVPWLSAGRGSFTTIDPRGATRHRGRGSMLTVGQIVGEFSQTPAASMVFSAGRGHLHHDRRPGRHDHLGRHDQ